MTLAEIKALIDTYYPDNTTGLINPAGERIVLKAISDFVVASQGEADTVPFVYDPAFSYALNAPVIYDNAWFLSLAGANLNNQPDVSPLSWDPVNAFNTVLSIWEADAVYLGTLTIVIKDNKLYLLDRDTVGADPYVSTDFTAELIAGDWLNLLPNSSPVQLPGYANNAVMFAAQASQAGGYFYIAGASLFIYLGTTVGDITDYFAVGAGGGGGGISSVGAGTGLDVDVTDPLNPLLFIDAATLIEIGEGVEANGWGDHALEGYLTNTNSDFEASTLPVAFDIPRKYGFTTAITANITFGITGAFESSMAKIRHNHTTAPTITGTGGVTVVKDGGTYVPSVDNTIWLVCHKNDAGTVTEVAYTITQDNP